MVTGKCLAMDKAGSKLLMSSCDSAENFQRWKFKTFDSDKAKAAGMFESKKK